MLLCSFLMALFVLFGKIAIGITSFFQLTFLRFAIPLILFLPYLLIKGSLKELFYQCNLRMELIRALCILVYQYSIFYYLLHASLLDATVLQNTAPLFIPILEALFFKYKFDRRVILSILISFVGILCILQPDKDIFARLSIAGLLVPLSQAGSQVLYGHQAKRENLTMTLFYQFFLTTICSGVIYLFASAFFGEADSLKNYSGLAWMNILALGLVSLLNQQLRGIAYRHGKPSALAPFLYVSLIFSALFDWTLFHNLPNWLSLLGATLVVAGGLIQVYFRTNK